MFVGVGASRVRDLFEQAKQNSPCIIFMDEIDAVGRHRGAGLGGGHDEREQTLNQLLVEMDGFEMKDNIILIAATNRPDILDPALLRPGRFDRQVVVDRPDRKGRARILEVHTRGKPLAKEIDLDNLAGQTPGFTGADLANLVNEAALLAAREGKREITQHELEEGIMRVIAGPEKKTRVMGEKERLVTAYHEMGHAIVAHFLEHTDPVHKISIISRGQALGYTISLPTEDKFLTTRAELADTLAMTLGGRAAEEIVFSEITTGAANDLEKVTATAKQMVMRFGMSEKLGPRTFGHDQSQPFLGREFSAEPDYSDEIAREIDDEIRRIVEEAHQTARQVLTDRREDLDRLSQAAARARDDRARGVRGAAGRQVRRRRCSARRSPREHAARAAGRGAERQPVPEPRPLPHPRPGSPPRCAARAEALESESADGSPRRSFRRCARPPSWASSTSRRTRSRTGASSWTPTRPWRTAERLAAEGADLIDVGGESTRPGAEPVARGRGAAARDARVERARGRGSRLSIDTSRRRSRGAALARGRVVRQRRHRAARRSRDGRRRGATSGADVCLMHMLGEPRTMQDDPRYDDVVAEVQGVPRGAACLRGRASGIAEERIWLDPGIGFGKTLEHNLELIAAPGRDRRARPPGGGRRLAQALHRRAHRPAERTGWPGPWRPT